MQSGIEGEHSDDRENSPRNAVDSTIRENGEPHETCPVDL
jgi:hypothetical protein